MVLARSAASRLPMAARFSRAARTTRSANSQPLQRIVQRSSRRGYSSAGGEHSQQSSSDLPWAIGAALITIPGTYYLLPTKVGGYGGPGGGHGGDHSDHGSGAQKEEAEKESEPEPEPEQEAKSEPQSEAKEEESKESEGEGGSEKDSTDAGEAVSSEVSEKSSNQEDVLEKQSDQMVKKQLGFANSPAFHPSNPDVNPSKSKKGEGVAETTKLEGTVDPGRPGR